MTDTLTASLPGTDQNDATWWRQAAVYQIYPRSFADANGDGIGDLAGIISRVPYLVSLGIDAVWLSPFYPSALADGGYDVDDYRDVDPKIGTLAEFDQLVSVLHESGIRLIVDIVPNHSSDRHEWFREALASPAGSAARDRYIFRDGTGPSGTEPPSDWPSIFGGSAWQAVGDGQFYLHFFAPEQPDFNWQNREVRDDFLTTLRFWSDRGVDGFRVDVAHGLAKNLAAGELPPHAELETVHPDGQHMLWDRDDVHEIYAEWRAVFNEYDPPRTAVAEAWVDASRRARYASPEGLGQAFNFDLLRADFDAGQFRTIITDNLQLAEQSGSSTTWVFSNHDVVRHATRYGLPPRVPSADETASADASEQAEASIFASESDPGHQWLLSGGTTPQLDRDRGLRRARAASLLMLALPGSAYLYQGEELGLHEVVEIADADRQDPSFFRHAGVEIGRDGCRVPLPWAPGGTSFGFGPDATAPAHLPQPSWFAESSVEVEDVDPSSTLNLYRSALDLRHRLQADEHLEWHSEAGATVLDFERPGGWRSVTNFGEVAVPLPTSAAALDLLLASEPLTADALRATGLPPATTVWLR